MPIHHVLRSAFALLLVLLSAPAVSGQSARTVGVLQFDSAQAVTGYTLFSPIRAKRTYLIDNCGFIVNQWSSNYNPALMAYLTDDGHLFHTGVDELTPTFRSGGGVGGYLELLDWDGNVVWSYLLSTPFQCQHHDAIVLPNGNVLALAWELFTDAEAVNAGRDPNLINQGEIWGEKLIELRPVLPDSAEVIWEWRVWDHVVQNYDATKPNFGIIADHPELLDLNWDEFGNGKKDWLHFNAVDYNAAEDQIVLSSRNTSEIYIIDHSTTPAEAAGHTGGRSGKGGDFLWRWGNPQVYDRGDASTRQFYWQHNPNWIDSGYVNSGKIIAFNNGTYRPGNDYSTVDLLDVLPDAQGNYALLADGTFAPAAPDWQYTAPNPTDLFSPFISGAQGLPNGNVLIANGNQGTFIEVNPAKDQVWRYRNPDIGNTIVVQGDSIPGESVADQLVNGVFRAVRYLPDHPGLADKVLTPGSTVEPDPNPVPCNALSRTNPSVLPAFVRYPNPGTTYLKVELPGRKTAKYRVVDALGREKQSGVMRAGSGELDLTDLLPGWYLLQVDGYAPQRFVKQ
ncbi:MAG: aryl-sulfate sulfotransferase [Bacteroidota bacterium]